MAANMWGEKRSKPMNTLNWEKMPTFQANKTIWGQGANESLQKLIGEGKTLALDVDRLEVMFAKPEVKPRSVAASEDKPKTTKVRIRKTLSCSFVALAAASVPTRRVLRLHKWYWLAPSARGQAMSAT
jgi:hypothetical protein